MLKISTILALVCALFANQASSQVVQEVTLQCEFEDYAINIFFEYTCILRGLDFNFSNPFYYTVIEGQHLPNRDNSHVRNLVIYNSNIDQIPANIFQVFPNLQAINVEDGGVTRINVQNFIFANNLQALFLSANNIPALTDSPFFGRGGITHLNLYSNGIQTISPTYFQGLSGLRYLVLSGNNIQTLASNQLAPLFNLRTFFASGNQLTRLSGNFFANNLQLEMVGLEFNNIEQVGSGFLNGLNNLIYVGLTDNTCFDGYFDNEDGVDGNDVTEALQTCFDNFIPDPPRVRTLTFELRGNMTIFNEARQELLHVIGREW